MNTPRAQAGRLGGRARGRGGGRAACRSARRPSSRSCATRDRIRERGLPVADYFLWNDDFEYSTRLIRGGVGLYCPDSVVVHKTRTFGSTDADPGERFFYEVRNKVWMFTRSAGLSPPEKALYGGSHRPPLGPHLRALARTAARCCAALAAGLRRRARARGPAPTPRCSPRPAGRRTSGPARPAGRPAAVHACCSRCTAATTRLPARRVHLQRPGPDPAARTQVVLVQDGPVPDELAADDRASWSRSSPVPGRPRRARARTSASGPALDRGLAACDARDRRPDGRRRRQPARPVRAAAAGHRGGRRHRRQRAARVRRVDVDDVVGRRTPADRPGRDPPGDPVPRPVQPPDGRLPAQRRAGGRRLHRHGADGGLPAVRADGRRRARGRPTWPSRWSATASAPGAYARRGGRQLLRVGAAPLQRRFRELGITTRAQYLRNVVVRGGYRLVPERLRKIAYRRLIANRGRAPAVGRLQAPRRTRTARVPDRPRTRSVC